MYGSRLTCLRWIQLKAGSTPMYYLQLHRLAYELHLLRFRFFHIIGPIFSPENKKGFFNFCGLFCLPYSWPFYTYPSITSTSFSSREFLPHRPSSGSLAYASRATGMVLPSWVMYVVYRVNQHLIYQGVVLLLCMGSRLTCLRWIQLKAGSTLCITFNFIGLLMSCTSFVSGFSILLDPSFHLKIKGVFQLLRLILPPVFLTLLYLP